MLDGLRCSGLITGLAFVVLGTSVHSGVDAAPVTYQAIAAYLDPAPGAQPGQYFRYFYTPSINNDGVIVFVAELGGEGIISSNADGIWKGTPGTLINVAREGNQAAGLASGVFYSSTSGTGFDATSASASDKIYFCSYLAGNVTQSNNSGFWLASPGGVELVIREGESAPGAAPGVVFSNPSASDSFSRFAMGSNNHIVLTALITGPGVVPWVNDLGLWSGQAGSLALAARTGDPAPGAGSDARFSDIGSAVVNRNGVVAFRAQIAGAGVDSSNDTGIWWGVPGNLQLIAREGDPAPGMPFGVSFGGFGNVNSPDINDVGEVAFIGYLVGAGIDVNNGVGIWTGQPGTIAPIARAGDPAPGTLPGVVFGFSFNTPPTINARGDVVLFANVSGSGVSFGNDYGIWCFRSGSLGLIAREGNAVPGFATNVVFDTFAAQAANGAGQVAYSCNIRGPGVTLANNVCLWFEDRAGVARLIARTGTAIQIRPGNVRTPSSFSFRANSGGQDGRSAALTDSGQIAFHMGFIDGSGALMLATVPCPDQSPGPVGDVDCDGGIGPGDAVALALALVDQSQYSTEHGCCDIGSADLNQDGLVNGVDIENFLFVTIAR